MKNDSSAHDLFAEKPLAEFWVSVQRLYAKISMAAFKIITPFVSIYLYERRFFTLVQIKTKTRNKLDVQDHIETGNFAYTTKNKKAMC